MRKRIVQGVAGFLVLLIAAGCKTTTLDLPAAPALGPPTAPQREAHLHLPAAPTTLDSVRANDAASFDLLGNLMEGLVRRGPDGALVGGVAERWESSDGQHYTFHLRKDARWSDGRQVTADEFVYAWMRALDPQHGSDYAFLLYEIEGAEAWNSLDPEQPDFFRLSAERMRQVQVSAPDSATLQVSLRAPNPAWAGYTTHPLFYPQRAALVGEGGVHFGEPEGFVGNGPFVVEGWTTGGEIRLKKSLAYWDAQAVKLERVSFQVERDGQVALRLFEMGELDQVFLPGELAVGSSGVESMAQPSTMGLVFNLSHPTAGNLQLRQAIHLALDRQRLVEQAAWHAGTLSAGLIPPSLAGGWVPAGDSVPPQGAKERALQLWESARKELKVEGLTLRLLYAEEAKGLATALQAMLEESLPGLTMTLESVPFDRRLDLVGRGQYEVALQGWTADHDDPLSLLALFVTDHPGNDARWINRTYGERVLAARLGEGDRRALLQEAERLLMAELPVVPLYHPTRFWLTSKRLKGLRYAPLSPRLDLRGAWVEG